MPMHETEKSPLPFGRTIYYTVVKFNELERCDVLRSCKKATHGQQLRRRRELPMIESAIDLRSHEARANAETMRELVADLRETAQNVRLGGGQAARERHLSRGKLLPRDRVRALIDP